MSACKPVALQFEFDAPPSAPMPEASSQVLDQESCGVGDMANDTVSRIPGAMRELFGHAANVIENTFRQIEIADELIRRASRRHPYRAHGRR